MHWMALRTSGSKIRNAKQSVFYHQKRRKIKGIGREGDGGKRDCVNVCYIFYICLVSPLPYNYE